MCSENPVSHPTDANNENLVPASTQQDYEVRRADLPLSCPMPNQKLWNAHPRVYLPIDKSGEEACPYCGARYRLVD